MHVMGMDGAVLLQQQQFPHPLGREMGLSD